MLAQKDFTFVNVHIPYEGEIERTDAFIPYNEIGDQINLLPVDKRAKIVLYCRSGHMSAMAGTTLAKLGYTNILNLDGGMLAWERAGYNLVTKSR
jgi:rhodanese-related sulfurtransferase